MNNFNCTIAVLLTYNKFRDVKNNLDKNEKFETSYGIPCFELPFTLECTSFYSDRIMIIQNNIRYLIYGGRQYTSNDFREQRFEMIYLDKDLKLSDEIYYALAPCLRSQKCKTNRIYNEVSYESLIKFI